jgi:fibronectin type 3 domain-containing protein
VTSIRVVARVAVMALVASLLPLGGLAAQVATAPPAEAAAVLDVPSTIPVAWSNISSPGAGVTCAVSRNGQLWCWGKAEGPRGVSWTADDGDPWTSGDGPAAGTPMPPTRVGAASNWTKVEVGFDHACALNSQGQIWCWGDNEYGELGVGSTNASKVPVRITLPAAEWTDLSIGRDRSCGLRGATAWCWGDNNDNSLFGSTHYAAGSVLLPRVHDREGLFDGVVQISVGAKLCLIRTNGTAGCFARGPWLTLLPLPNNRTWTQIRAKGYNGDKAFEDHWDYALWSVCAIRSDKTAWCFLALPTLLLEPTQLGSYSDWSELGFRADQPRDPVCGVRTGGKVTCFSWFGREVEGPVIGTGGRGSGPPYRIRSFSDTAEPRSFFTRFGNPPQCWGDNCYYLNFGPDVLDDYTGLDWMLPAGITAQSVHGGFFQESVAWDPSFVRWGRLWVLDTDGRLWVMGDGGRAERMDGRSDDYPMTFARALVADPTLTQIDGGSSVYAPRTGGRQVTLSGTFLTAVESIAFGAEAATTWSESEDATSLTVTVPASAQSGPVNVTVVTAGGTVSLPNAVNYATAPSAPTITAVQEGAASATVTWSPSASAGTRPITSYVVKATPGGRTCTWTSGPFTCTVTGLANGTAYTLVVQGVSEVGAGTGSSPSAAVVPFTVPGSPVLTAATPGNGQIEVAWEAPDSGGSPLTGYVAAVSPGGQTCDASPTGTACSIDGLTNGTPYSVSVYASNAGGDGAIATWPASVTPRTVPGAPRSVTVTPADRSLVVRWLAPSNNGGAAVTGYTATAQPGNTTCEAASPALTCTINGLTNGTTYEIRVTATNPAGPSVSADPATATPVTVPGRPTITAVEAGNGTATITWRAPTSNGGAPVTEYVATGSPAGSCTWKTGPLSCSVTQLSNGTSHSFTVRARNVAGFGAESVAFTATPRTRPDPPQDVEVQAQDESLIVSWQPPLDNGGAAVTGYTVTAQPGGETCAVDAGTLACALGGLANGVRYAVEVVATNAAGVGDPSAPAEGTPRTRPDGVENVEVLPDNRSALVTWTEPAWDGGAPITTYRVTTQPAAGSCITSELGCTVSGLTNGRLYVFIVTATNEAGTSDPVSSESTRVAIVPTQPRTVKATPGDGRMDVSWQVPVSDGGSPIAGYTVTDQDGEILCSWSSGPLRCTATGLTNGREYEVSVTASNAMGEGPPSQPVAATPGRAPDPVASVDVTPAAGAIDVSWEMPEDDGGHEVTSVRATAVPGGRSCTATAEDTSCQITRLTTGATYSVRVEAFNKIGKSPPVVSPSVRVMGVPGKVRGFYGSGKTTSITLYFSPPAVNGGSVVTEYFLECTGGGRTIELEVTKSPVVVTGLSRRTRYTCRMEAANQYGVGAPATASVSTR